MVFVEDARLWQEERFASALMTVRRFFAFYPIYTK